VPVESGWIVQGWAADPTSGSLQNADATSASLQKADLTSRSLEGGKLRENRAKFRKLLNNQNVRAKFPDRVFSVFPRLKTWGRTI